MTPELAPFEAAILRLRHELGMRPLPSDRYLRAGVCAVAAVHHAEGLVSRAIAKSAIVEAMRIEVSDLLGLAGAWGDAASGFLAVREEEAPRSPFPALVDAMTSGESEGALWTLSRDGKWTRREESAHGAE